jgi:D-serine deaminase-like pyridoxal phosphate-dependent protein
LGVWLGLDSGMHRTGIEVGVAAEELYEQICTAPHIEPCGLHWYDGHIRQSDSHERKAACLADWSRLIGFRNRLMVQGLPVPAIVAAGTGSFPILAELEEPGLELSPGTVAFYDAGYRRQFPELPFIPAIAILTRVVSRQRSDHVTLDLGHKACAADPPAGQRLEFPAWPDAEEVQQSEEHLVLKTQFANGLRVGDCTLAIPIHACPTSAAYDTATVIRDGRPIETWKIYARGRKITI